MYYLPETVIQTLFGKIYVWLHPHCSLKPYSYSPRGSSFILKVSFVSDFTLLTTVLVTVFCGTPLNQIFLYGTLFFGKVNSYGIEMHLPYSTFMCVVTLIEKSVSYEVSAGRRKIITTKTISIPFFSLWDVFILITVVWNTVHHTFETLNLAAPGLKKRGKESLSSSKSSLCSGVTGEQILFFKFFCKLHL